MNRKHIEALDKVFSTYIRKRDSIDGIIGKCCTCGKVGEIKYMHCGHFMSRRHLSTRWEEKNTACQCVSCNLYNQGKQYEFSLYLDRKYGAGTSEKMRIKASNTCKMSDVEAKILIKHYKQKEKELCFT